MWKQVNYRNKIILLPVLGIAKSIVNPFPMSQFLTSHALNNSLEEIIRNARKKLIIVSPYIKLHKRYKDTLTERIKDSKLRIYLVFREKKGDRFKNIKDIDLEFFKGFPNIQICINRNIHAKFYANENQSLLTSMNMYDYSQKINIEFGILYHSGNHPYLPKEQAKLNLDIKKKVCKLISESEIIWGSKDTNPLVLFPEIGSDKPIDQIGDEKGGQMLHEPNPFDDEEQGYCIRTGKPIKFNLGKPYCNAAYETWKQFSNRDYEEKYCHFSGEKSDGKTSHNKPVLLKNWAAALEKYPHLINKTANKKVVRVY